MKKTFLSVWLASLLCLLSLAAKAQVTASCEKISIQPGETQEVKISLNNGSIDITDFEGYIALPEGISFVAAHDGNYCKMTGREVAGQALNEGLQSDGRLLFGIYQMTGTTGFTGESGDVVAFTIKADENLALGDYELNFEEGLAVTIDATSYETPFTTGLTVYKAMTVSVTSSNDEWGTVTGGVTDVMPNSTTTLTATPTDGYSFVNWTEGETVVSEANPYELTVTADATIVGNFKANQYSITFDSDGGTEVATITQDYNTAITAPTAPTKTGYTFAGWNPALPETMPLDGAALTAQWTINQYSLTLVLGNGEENVVLTQDYASAIEAPTPERTGYTFAGWDSEVPSTMPAEDKTFTAQWTINQYTMTFALANGEDDVVLTQDYATELEAPAPTRTGYTFAGWQPEVPSTVPAENTTYTAQWTVNQYTLTFVLGNGEENVVLTQDYATDVTAPTPTRTGYTFNGWDGEVPSTMPAENKTFTAQWTINQYTMTFVLGNGEENTVLTQDYATELEAPVPTRTGYTFAGWQPEVPATVPAENSTYTAQWTINQYSLTFVLGNGEENVVLTQDYATDVTAPVPTRTGYTFAGWDGEVPETVLAENSTYTAQWTVNQYTMTFVQGNSEKGITLDNVTLTQDYGTAIEAPTPTFEDHTFKRWTPEVPATVPAEDMTFTAVWDTQAYSLKFVADDMTIYDEMVEEEAPLYGIASTIDVPAKAGYEFTGWSPAITEETLMPSEATAYTAQYAKKSITVTFSFGGNGQQEQQTTAEYGDALTAPTVSAWAGHHFTGWSPAVPETMPAENTTYTAQWQISAYTITCNLDGGTLPDGTQWPAFYTIESDDITLPTPTREGYEFLGWTGTGLAEATTTVTIARGSTGSRQYTAQWKAIEVTPVEEETTVDIRKLADTDLTNTVVDDVYYNLGEDAYDTADQSIVISQPTDMQVIADKTPGSDDVRTAYNGLIMQVAKGTGSITVNSLTLGDALLAVQVGADGTPTTAQQSEKGDVVVRYTAEDDAYVYIYSTTQAQLASLHSPLSSLTATDADAVKIYSITITPDATAVKAIGEGESTPTATNLYDLSGRKLTMAPAKGGIYVARGKKVIKH